METIEKTGKQKRQERNAQLNATFRESKKNAKKRRAIEKFDKRFNIHNMQALFFTPCIYFLKCNNQVVYIGETKSAMTRISQHIADNVKIFDSVSFEPFEGSDMERKEEEADLIRRIKPIYNIVHNTQEVTILTKPLRI
jgi:excinuclease UvrABC nuclease subunit